MVTATTSPPASRSPAPQSARTSPWHRRRNIRYPRPFWTRRIAELPATNPAVDWVLKPIEAATGADVLYTDTWISMGQEDEKAERIAIFGDYKIDEELAKSAKPDFLFMHDMPAYRGQELSEGMIDHPNSVVFDQAENRMHAQKAVLAAIFE